MRPAVPDTPKLLKVAKPRTAVAVVVPLKIAPDEIDAVIVAVFRKTRFALASTTVICGWVVNCAPLFPPTDALLIDNADGGASTFTFT